MSYPALVLPALLAFAGNGTSRTAWTTPSASEVDAIYPDIEALYIDLHQNPELGFQEVETASKLAARVKALGYEVTTGVGRTGIVAVLKNGPGTTVMLRTELDALPVEEKTGLPFASKAVVRNADGQLTPVMHACGHDIHMAAWAGAARLMAEHRDRWHGTLMLVGQPAEEGLGGAAAMLKDGLFARFPRPDFALSLHDDDTMPAGTIGYHAGPFRARADAVTIIVHGRGGHAAMPMNTVDPIVLAARIVLALQTIVSRENNPTDPVVITVGSIHGAAPREPEVGVPSNVDAAVVYNDPALTLRLARALRAGLGDKNVVEMPAKMTSEDFSAYWVTGKVPSALLHIGAVNPASFEEIRKSGIPGPAPHSAQWAPDREPTLKGAVRAEVTELLELFKGQ
jgi:hippurate hydrolase